MRHALLGVLVLVASCATPVSPSDAGSDVRSNDAVSIDAPAYVPPDTGPLGTALMPTMACTDVAAQLYATPAGLSPFTVGVRGNLLGCSLIETIRPADLRTRLAGIPDLVLNGGSVRVYLIAYRTEREPRGVGGISTALVYLPDAPIGERVPMVLAAHGTVGLDDHCAPSHLIHDPTSFLPQTYLDALLLAWAARGMPVVAPDYAGLGTEGVHGFTNWLDPARSAIDGVRALRSMLPAARLTGDTLVYGHSQGGGVAFTVAALASEAPDVHLAAIVAMSPGYRFFSSLTLIGSRGIALTPTIRAFTAMGLYADLANLSADSAQWGTGFAASVRDPVVMRAGTLCYFDAITALDTPATGYVPPATIGDLVDATFGAAAAACSTGGSCAGLPGAWVARDMANEPHLSPSGPPVLVLGSTDDDQLTIGQLGCAIQRVVHDGVTPDVCIVSGPNHLAMVSTTDAYGMAWALAASSGSPRPPCAASTTSPHCRF